MSGNTFGHLFTVTSFGESHGPAIGCVVDGCPPGLAITAEEIQLELDRRKPGTSRHVTQRKEPDTVEILSGVFEGKTTGTPIALLIRNQDQRSHDYGKIAETFAPAMPITPIGINMAFAIIAAAGARLRARQRCVWPLGPLPRNGSRKSLALRFVATCINWARSPFRS